MACGMQGLVNGLCLCQCAGYRGPRLLNNSGQLVAGADNLGKIRFNPANHGQLFIQLLFKTRRCRFQFIGAFRYPLSFVQQGTSGRLQAAGLLTDAICQAAHRIGYCPGCIILGRYRRCKIKVGGHCLYCVLQPRQRLGQFFPVIPRHRH